MPIVVELNVNRPVDRLVVTVDPLAGRLTWTRRSGSALASMSLASGSTTIWRFLNTRTWSGLAIGWILPALLTSTLSVPSLCFLPSLTVRATSLTQRRSCPDRAR